jgi:polar amino acid transport system substrate-binding protein
MMRRWCAVLLSLASVQAQAQEPARWPTVYVHSLQGVTLHDTALLLPRPGSGPRAFSLALAQALLQQLGRTQVVSDVPLARALKALDARQPAWLVGLLRTPARELRYQWVLPLYRDTLVFYQSPLRPLAATSWQQARQLPVCVVYGSAPEEYAVQFGLQRVERSSSYALCLRMLAAGRVRLAPVVAGDLKAKLQEAGLSVAAVQPSPLPTVPLQSYLVASHATPPAEVQAWHQAWQQLAASAAYRQLRQRYWP